MFCFDKGSDILVRVDGETVGGIVRLRRIVKDSPDEIREFLTDKPVARIPRKSYVLRFYMCCSGGCVFDGDFDSIEIRDRHKTETYTMCTAERCESRAYQHTDVDYIVTVTAKERSVAVE